MKGIGQKDPGLWIHKQDAPKPSWSLWFLGVGMPYFLQNKEANNGGGQMATKGIWQTEGKQSKMEYSEACICSIPRAAKPGSGHPDMDRHIIGASAPGPLFPFFGVATGLQPNVPI